VSGDFPVRAYLIGRPAVCCGVVLVVCPSVVSFSKFHEHDTHDSLHDLLQTSRYHPSCILVRFPRDMLSTSSWHLLYQNATRKLFPWNFSLSAHAWHDCHDPIGAAAAGAHNGHRMPDCRPLL